MSDGAQTRGIDFAAAVQREAWLHHSIYGDPSWDSFERRPGNPVVRGRPPREWPVNCFLFIDPVSGDWFLYVGHYSKGYDFGPGKPPAICRVCRSRDRGGRWEDLGPIFPPESFAFEDDPTALVGSAPDVSVVYDDGRYHLTYDWGNDACTWENAHHPQPGADNGIAYAWAARPEGPFIRHPRPIYRCSSKAAYPLLGKYARFYAQTLIRRQDDWLILAMSDAGIAYSWALIAITAPRPEGPWSDWTFIRMVDSDEYHPPLMEFFPAFVHEGHVYAPSTSVAANRNFQMLLRAPVERAHDPQAWEIQQHGSVWHAEDVANEHDGLWGQTYSGAVDSAGTLWAGFPSRDSQGMGTINLASRPWNKPFRDRNFILTGHRARSLTCLRRTYERFTLDARLTLRGICQILWDHRGPVGPDRAVVDSAVHDLSLTNCGGLKLSANRWELFRVDGQGIRTVVAAAPAAASPMPAHRRVIIDRQTPGHLSCALDGLSIWQGSWPDSSGGPGTLALVAEKESRVEVGRFEVVGEAAPARRFYLCTEALLGAGNRLADWQELQSPAFVYGCGAVSLRPDARVKWNILGDDFTLWSPSGPDFGRCQIRLDGRAVGEIDLRSATLTRSRPVFTLSGFVCGYHAVVLRAIDGQLVVDTLEVHDNGL